MKRLALRLQRAVRALARVSGEVGTPALSLGMLVFLVLEARATALSQETTLVGEPMDASDLDAVRQVYGDSAADQVAGIDYTAIADAVAQISDLYAQEALAEDAAGADLADQEAAADAEQGGSDAGFELLDQYLQDAVQYAQLSTGGIAAEGAEAAVSGGTAAGGTAAGGAAAGGTAASFGATLASVLPGLAAVVGAAAVVSSASSSTSTSTSTSSSSTSSSSTSTSAAASTATTSNSGTVVNGYISGATVFQDLNGDGVWQDGEPTAVTGADGTFSLNVLTDTAYAGAFIVMSGGTDLSTGLAYTSILKGPVGSTTITPLTTLVSALMASGQTQAAAVS